MPRFLIIRRLNGFLSWILKRTFSFHPTNFFIFAMKNIIVSISYNFCYSEYYFFLPYCTFSLFIFNENKELNFHLK